MYTHIPEEKKTRYTEGNICCKKHTRERTREWCIFHPFVRSDPDPWLCRTKQETQDGEETKEWGYKWDQGQTEPDTRTEMPCAISCPLRKTVPLSAESQQVEFRMSSCCHKIAEYVHPAPTHFITFSNGADVVHALQARQIVLMPCFAQKYNLIVSDFLCKHKNILNILPISLESCSECSSFFTTWLTWEKLQPQSLKTWVINQVDFSPPKSFSDSFGNMKPVRTFQWQRTGQIGAVHIPSELLQKAYR